MNREQNSAGRNIQQVLENGEITLQGQFLLGSNYTFLVKVKYEDQLVDAVYKPMRGEQPLWDFPPASLAGREVAAYIVSEALGLGFVPATVLREGPFGPGSLQLHIDYNPNYHYFNFKAADRVRLVPVALFDLLVNNADRKGSHVFFQKRTRRLFSIDHGLCFHEEDKLRTVIWDFAGQTIPAGTHRRFAGDIRTGAISHPGAIPCAGRVPDRRGIDGVKSARRCVIGKSGFPRPARGPARVSLPTLIITPLSPGGETHVPLSSCPAWFWKCRPRLCPPAAAQRRRTQVQPTASTSS